MAQEIIAGHLGEERALTTADGGTALTSSAVYIQFPALSQPGDSAQGLLSMTPRNFATAVVVQIQLNPWLTILKTSNNMETKPVDYSIEAQDASTATSVDLSSLNTVANGDWVLVGSHIPFSGMQIDVDGTNSTATTTVTISYWNGSAWTDTGDTDGTKSSTHLDQDGAITWTVPAAWTPEPLSEIYQNLKFNGYYRDVPLYWLRWEVDKALDTAVTLDSVLSINRSTAVAEYVFGQTKEQRIKYGFGGHGNIAALTNAGTANLIANLAIEGTF